VSSDDQQPERVYGPRAVAVGIAAGVGGALASLPAAALAGEWDPSQPLTPWLASAGVLAASWACSAVAAAAAGRLARSRAAMAWVALSSLRLLALLVLAAALALASGDLGLGYWVGLLAGGLASQAADCAGAIWAVRSFGRAPAGGAIDGGAR